MSIKVVDLNTEETKELPPIEEEEEITNEVVEQTNEEVKEEVKEEVQEEAKEEVKEAVIEEAKPKPIRAQDKIITCPKCNTGMGTSKIVKEV